MKEKILLWTPRILAVLAILFLMLFSMDCFEEGQGIKEQLICFFMHNIPAFIIVAILIVAWKWEQIGGMLFIVAAFAGSIFFNGFRGNWGVNIIMAPFLISGILFLIHFFKYNRNKSSASPGPFM